MLIEKREQRFAGNPLEGNAQNAGQATFPTAINLHIGDMGADELLHLVAQGEHMGRCGFHREDCFRLRWFNPFCTKRQFGCCCHTDDACQVFRPCAVTTFLRSPADKRLSLQPALAVQEAHAFRPMELVRRYRKSIDSQGFNVQRSMGIRLHRIGMEGHIMLVG